MSRQFYDDHGGYQGHVSGGSFYGARGGYQGHGDAGGSFYGSDGGYEGRSDDGDGTAFGIFKSFFG